MTNYGATKRDWAHFDVTLGLTEDLLPVVSNPLATISPDSRMKGLGKTPSVYTSGKQVVGFSKWTSNVATSKDIAKWSVQPDYGICIQCRTVRGLDVDVTDPDEAYALEKIIVKHVGKLPKRMRGNSSKFLVAFSLEDGADELYKRAFKTKHGIVELLASGQQFIAVGTHPSGVKYEWVGGLPVVIPTISKEKLEALWSDLSDSFAVEAPSSSNAPVKNTMLLSAVAADPVYAFLEEKGLVKAKEKDGRLHISCPFESEHTSDSAISATTYFPANTGGFARGHFDCRHAHCEKRSDEEFLEAIGYSDLAFDDLTNVEHDALPVTQTNPQRFAPFQAAEFSAGKPPSWLIKTLLPQAELIVLFGASGSGKTFMALDLAAHIAQGIDWRGLRTKKGRVVIIAAEGAGGLRNRLIAYSMTHGVDLSLLDIYVIPAAPNFLNKQDALDVAAAIVPLKPTLVIVDTWAQTTAGANENSGEDMGVALSHCKGIHRATGATIMLVHHSGKNAAAGARGWSGLRAAADAELEVLRDEDNRVLASTKQKDGEDGSEYGFKLNVVPIGLDDDGDTITSCVVEEAAVVAVRSLQKVGKHEQIVMTVVADHTTLHDIAPDVNTVVTKAIEEIPHEKGTRDRRYDIVTRAYRKLIERKLLEEVDGRVVAT